MAIREYLCKSCGYLFEEIISGETPTTHDCPHCDTKTGILLPSAHGGYSMSSGGSSTRPKGAGSFKGKTVREEQLEFEFLRDKK